MMSKIKNNRKAQFAVDAVKSFLQWLVVSILGGLYWVFVLLLASIFLMNIWKTSLESIVKYGIILGIITSAIYAGVIIYRKIK